MVQLQKQREYIKGPPKLETSFFGITPGLFINANMSILMIFPQELLLLIKQRIAMRS